MIRKFNFSQEILDIFNKGNNIVVQAPMGFGKSETVKHYASLGHKCLIVVDDKETQAKYQKDIRCVIYNTDCKHSFSSVATGKETLIITKAKFNRIIVTDAEVLSRYDAVIIDESSGLSPICMTNLKCGLEGTIQLINDVLLQNDDLYNKYIAFVCYIRKTYKEIVRNEQIVQFYRYAIGEDKLEMANSLRKDFVEMYKNGLLYNSKADIFAIFSLLDSLSAGNLYFGDRRINGKKVTHMLYANEFLKDMIYGTMTPIFILDATASLMKGLYNYLGIPIIEFTKPQYPNLTFHLHKYKYLSSSAGRKSDDYTLKILEDIKKAGRQTVLTFGIKKQADLLKDNDFDPIDYVFSGRDIGSNQYREHDSMNVLYFQTLPIDFLALYNRIMLGLDVDTAGSHRELQITEARLVANRLVQLIGRLVIRDDSNAKVDVHFYCVDYNQIEIAKEFFELDDTQVIEYDEVDIGIPKKKITIDDICSTIRFINQYRYKGLNINLTEEIRSSYYSVTTPNSTIKNWIRGNNKVKIEELCTSLNIKLESRKGRYGGTFLIFD